jgi:hypothetical protein
MQLCATSPPRKAAESSGRTIFIPRVVTTRISTAATQRTNSLAAGMASFACQRSPRLILARAQMSTVTQSGFSGAKHARSSVQMCRTARRNSRIALQTTNARLTHRERFNGGASLRGQVIACAVGLVCAHCRRALSPRSWRDAGRRHNPAPCNISDGYHW